MKVGFVVRNWFQIRQFELLAGAYSKADYLLYNEKTLKEDFSQTDFDSLNHPVKIFNKDTIEYLSTKYDCLFFQTVFPGVELINQTPLVSVQYGLAKERHNYGEWRALADLHLMYGPYSSAIVSHYGPSYPVGNLKYAGWDIDNLEKTKSVIKSSLALDFKKPTLLFMPTYGALGSMDEIIPILATMVDDYEIIIKGHHNDRISTNDWQSQASKLGLTHFYGGDADQKKLLNAADVVVSDFSGAIFDAVYARIPVVLFHSNHSKKVGIQKFELSSLEFRERKTIGEVCDNTNKLPHITKSVLDRKEFYIKNASSLRDHLFSDARSFEVIHRTKEIISNEIRSYGSTLSKPQTYVRESVKRLITLERQLSKKRPSLHPAELMSHIKRRLVSKWR